MVLAFCLGKDFKEFCCAACALSLGYKLKLLVLCLLYSPPNLGKKKEGGGKNNTPSNFLAVQVWPCSGDHDADRCRSCGVLKWRHKSFQAMDCRF